VTIIAQHAVRRYTPLLLVPLLLVSLPDVEPQAASTNIRLPTIDMRFMSSPTIR
jgi:hypothetical protein